MSIDPLDRPTMPAETAPTARRVRPTRTTKRLTIDLSVPVHAELRHWATEVDVPASYLLRELLALAWADPMVKNRVESMALDALDRRHAAS